MLSVRRSTRAISHQLLVDLKQPQRHQHQQQLTAQSNRILPLQSNDRHFHRSTKRTMSDANSKSTTNVGITTDDQTNAKERRAKGEFVRGVSTARDWISTEKDTKY